MFCWCHALFGIEERSFPFFWKGSLSFTKTSNPTSIFFWAEGCVGREDKALGVGGALALPDGASNLLPATVALAIARRRSCYRLPVASPSQPNMSPRASQFPAAPRSLLPRPVPPPVTCSSFLFWCWDREILEMTAVASTGSWTKGWEVEKEKIPVNVKVTPNVVISLLCIRLPVF